MKLSEPAKFIISLLLANGEPRSTNFIIGNTYKIYNKEFKATEELYDELVRYRNYIPGPYKINRHGKVVNLIGTKI